MCKKFEANFSLRTESKPATIYQCAIAASTADRERHNKNSSKLSAQCDEQKPQRFYPNFQIIVITFLL